MGVYGIPYKIKTISQVLEGSDILKMIPKKYSWLFTMSQFFQSICMKVPKFWLSDKNYFSIGDRHVWNPFRNQNNWSYKAQMRLEMISKKYSWWLMISIVTNFPKFLHGGLQILIIRQKWRFNKWLAGVRSLPKSKLLVLEGSNMALNDPKESAHGYPWCQQS